MIDSNHLAHVYQDSEWSDAYKEGDILDARIIFVDHAGKSVRLSLRPHVISFCRPMVRLSLPLNRDASEKLFPTLLRCGSWVLGLARAGRYCGRL